MKVMYQVNYSAAAMVGRGESRCPRRGRPRIKRVAREARRAVAAAAQAARPRGGGRGRGGSPAGPERHAGAGQRRGAPVHPALRLAAGRRRHASDACEDLRRPADPGFQPPDRGGPGRSRSARRRCRAVSGTSSRWAWSPGRPSPAPGATGTDAGRRVARGAAGPGPDHDALGGRDARRGRGAGRGHARRGAAGRVGDVLRLRQQGTARRCSTAGRTTRPPTRTDLVPGPPPVRTAIIVASLAPWPKRPMTLRRPGDGSLSTRTAAAPATMSAASNPGADGLEDTDFEDDGVLDSSDTLEDSEDPYEDPLDPGIEPADKWSAGERFGDTLAEERQGESLDQLLAEEEPDVDPYPDPDPQAEGDLPREGPEPLRRAAAAGRPPGGRRTRGPPGPGAGPGGRGRGHRRGWRGRRRGRGPPDRRGRGRDRRRPGGLSRGRRWPVC